MSVREIIAVYLWLDVNAFDTGIMFKSIHLDFIVEVTDVADNSLVLHLRHVVDTDNVDVACCGNKDIALCAGFFHGYYLKALHSGLQSANRVYFRNQYAGTV